MKRISFFILALIGTVVNLQAQETEIFLERNNWNPTSDNMPYELSFNDKGSLMAVSTFRINKKTYKLEDYKSSLFNIKEGRHVRFDKKNVFLAFSGDSLIETSAKEWSNPKTHQAYFLNPVSFERNEKLPEQAPFVYKDFFINMKLGKTNAHSITISKGFGNKSKEIYKTEGATVRINNGKVWILHKINEPKITVYDLEKGTSNDYTLAACPSVELSSVQFTKNNILVYQVSMKYDLRVFNMETKEDKLLTSGVVSCFAVSSDGKKVAYCSSKTLLVKDIENEKILFKSDITNIKDAIVSKLVRVNNSDVLLIPLQNDLIRIFSFSQMDFTADVYIDRNNTDWAVVAVDGQIDGTTEALKTLDWCQYNGIKLLKRTSLYETMGINYTPRLLALAMNDKIEVPDRTVVKKELIAQVNEKPLVKILNPKNGTNISANNIIVDVSAQDNGDPVKEVSLYINNKLFENSIRGFKNVNNVNKSSYTIPLNEGENIIKAIAKSEKGYESDPAYVSVFFEAPEIQKPKMYVLAIGINTYLNPKYNLNYAQNDAQSFVKAIKEKGQSIFDEIEVAELYNENATRNGILTAINKIRTNSVSQDVLIIYYAGHGVMSVEQDTRDSEYFIIPNNVTQMYAQANVLESSAISSAQLMEMLKDIKAQKQLLLLDACQSGGAVETFAMRGAAEEKAIAQLARSTGTYVIAASGTEQFATEVKDLGHGIFTYALLQSLNGNCKNVNQQITVGILKSCIEEMVPELSAKHKGQMQFPTGFGFGQDFPIGIVK